MKRARVGGVVLLLALFGERPAHAASCVFNSITPVAFGPYDVFSATADDAVGSFTFQCSLLQVLDAITINISSGSSGTYSSRTMLNGANTLNYNLYMDPARSMVWGDNSSGTSNYTALLAALPVTLSVYGRIPARQNAKAGNFADTVVVTLLF